MIPNSLISELNYGRNNVETYEGLIDSSRYPIDQDTYFQSVYLLMEEGERLLLLGQTKFTARKYFDILLSHTPLLSDQEIVPTIVGCLRTAVKQCQSQKVSELYTLQYAVDQCGQQASYIFFQEIELRILSLLRMKTKLVTPFWYMEVVKDLFPEKDITLPQLTSLIDFIMIQPELSFVCAEEFFFSALITFFRQKKSSPICYQIIKAITPKWSSAISLAQCLSSKINQTD